MLIHMSWPALYDTKGIDEVTLIIIINILIVVVIFAGLARQGWQTINELSCHVLCRDLPLAVEERERESENIVHISFKH